MIVLHGAQEDVLQRVPFEIEVADSDTEVVGHGVDVADVAIPGQHQLEPPGVGYRHLAAELGQRTGKSLVGGLQLDLDK
jgi:hypothetical protein